MSTQSRCPNGVTRLGGLDEFGARPRRSDFRTAVPQADGRQYWAWSGFQPAIMIRTPAARNSAAISSGIASVTMTSISLTSQTIVPDLARNLELSTNRITSSARSISRRSAATRTTSHREALDAAQARNDTMIAFQSLRRAYTIDVSPIITRARLEAQGAIDVLGVYRESQWRERKAQERKPVGLGAGIV